jgi:hypothetical protein
MAVKSIVIRHPHLLQVVEAMRATGFGRGLAETAENLILEGDRVKREEAEEKAKTGVNRVPRPIRAIGKRSSGVTEDQLFIRRFHSEPTNLPSFCARGAASRQGGRRHTILGRLQCGEIAGRCGRHTWREHVSAIAQIPWARGTWLERGPD